jgi:predicted O-methyltransferase YrrM
MTAVKLNVETIAELYRKYETSLAAVRDAQRAFHQANQATMTPQLDDHEAEITYLLIREYRPETVMELGTFHGWSTTWILSALRDNEFGHLHSYDIVDNVVQNVPAELSGDRWTFHQGDIKTNLDAVPAQVDYLFVDAAHGAAFGRWYLAELFPKMPPGIPVSVHDVFHYRFTLPFHEGKVVVNWLDQHGVEYFTAAAARNPQAYQALHAVKRELGMAPVRDSKDNPMIWFNLPG